jgi:hypothetical protein
MDGYGRRRLVLVMIMLIMAMLVIVQADDELSPPSSLLPAPLFPSE